MGDKFNYISFNQWSSLKALKKTERDNIILDILYETGCTVNELINIKISDISFKHNQIKIQKENSRNKEGREVYVGSTLLKSLKRFIKKNPKINSKFILSTRQSPQITTKRVRQIVQLNLKKCGIKKGGPQILRYTHIAHAYQKKIPIDAIQEQVGLKRSRAIEIFSQLSMTNKKEVYKNFTK